MSTFSKPSFQCIEKSIRHSRGVFVKDFNIRCHRLL